jgi:cytochrome c oxidase assembly factor CtaG
VWHVIGAVLLVIGAVCHVIRANLKLKSNETKWNLYKLFLYYSILILSLN